MALMRDPMASINLSYDDVEWLDSQFNVLSEMMAEDDEVKMEIVDGKVQPTSTMTSTLIKGSGHNNPPDSAQLLQDLQKLNQALAPVGAFFFC